MIKAAVFDMFETLVSLFSCENYQGRKVMEDMGLSREKFRPIWDGTEEDRTCGRMTFEEVIERIMSVNGCYSDELFQKIVRKRKQALKNAYMNLNPEIIPMLRILKANGIRIGLITNCFFEEREAMKDSEMFGFFDVPCLSCELGIQKPDRAIFDICLERLGLEPDECLYIGDGGSSELETAAKVGMHPMQAVWYLKEGTNQPKQRMSEFENLESPMDVVKRIFTENMRSKPIMRAGEATKRKKLSEMTLEELWQLFPIVLTEHRDCWVQWYEEEKACLTSILPDKVIINHIGSTAIDKIWAKPIIDILIELPQDSDMNSIRDLLVSNGYICMSGSGSRVSLNKGYTEAGFAERVFHVHLRFMGDNDEIAFRDYLNGHPDTAREYEQLKLSLWKDYEHDRDGYTEAKTEFIRKCMKLAGYGE